MQVVVEYPCHTFMYLFAKDVDINICADVRAVPFESCPVCEGPLDYFHGIGIRHSSISVYMPELEELEFMIVKSGYLQTEFKEGMVKGRQKGGKFILSE